MLGLRHTMVEFSVEERLRSAETVCGGLLAPFRQPALQEQVRRAFAADAIPGIVCGPKAALPPNYVQLGVSFPFRAEDSRVRALFALPPERIGKTHSPYDVMRQLRDDAFEAADALKALRALCSAHGVEVGLFGSAALQVLTGLPYLEPISDVDAVVRPTSYARLGRVHAGLADLRLQYQRKFDVEVTLPSGLGIKLSELMSSTSTVLGRGIDGVRLLDRSAVVHALDQSVCSSVSDGFTASEES
ncbi:malonate decarboxylase holo-[acyl-carrier-protein] synthase [Rhodopseudomonas palustris]|uniref:Phosphoribosyl-dephospho-CoA transferase MdcG C-terminal domain-containing protein n=1 Tax=Rhodopseudomonas palustris (strain BisB18) TaxID=316056 RepID=Q21AG0_RHOPB